MPALSAKLCVLSLISISVLAPLYPLHHTHAQDMGRLDNPPSQGRVATQWSTFDVPTDLGLPAKREPGGTR